MTIVGFAILVLLVLLLIWLYTVIAKVPGEKARERSHPQAEAINVLGWFGLLLGIAPWLIALVWAHANIGPGATNSGAASEPTGSD